jgi:hypothetical protein
MDWKWIDRSYQFEGEPSGGGGEPPAPPAEPPTEPAAPSAEPPAEPTPPAEPPAPTYVAQPEGLAGLFAPAEPAPGGETWTPPPAAPAQPPAQPEPPKGPPKVDFPTGDDWIADPGKAAKQQAEAIAYSNWESQQPLHSAINELRQGVQGMKQGDFEAIAQRVDRSIGETETAVGQMYSETGALNSDKEFRENPDLQKAVENIIGACVASAIQKADRTGDTKQLERISKDPRFPYRALALAKADSKHSVPEGALRPGASPVGPQAPGAPKGDGLSEEDRAALAAARADGVNLTAADIRKARELTSKSIY